MNATQLKGDCFVSEKYTVWGGAATRTRQGEDGEVRVE